MSAASFVTSVPVIPIATPMSAALERGGVVDAVTGHRDDVALPLQHVDEPHLVLRSDPGDDADLAHLCAELLVADRRELGAGQGAALDPELAGDRGRGRGVVAGDHPDPDAGVLAEGDRVPRLLARRVDDADEGEQRQVLHLREQVAAGVEGRGVEVARGHRQHAQALAGEPVVLGQDTIACAALRARSSRRRPGSATSARAARRARP